VSSQVNRFGAVSGLTPIQFPFDDMVERFFYGMQIAGQRIQEIHNDRWRLAAGTLRKAIAPSIAPAARIS
jgi:hypothetical protein